MKQCELTVFTNNYRKSAIVHISWHTKNKLRVSRKLEIVSMFIFTRRNTNNNNTK